MTPEPQSATAYGPISTRLLRQSESATLERLNRPSASAVGRTVCAFLNNSGGRIIIGLEDDGRVVGVDKAETAVANLREELFDLLKPMAGFLVNGFEASGKKVLLVEVAPGADGPYAYKGSIYTRVEKSTRIASPADVRALVKQLDDTPRWEAQTTLHVDLTNLDQEELDRTAKDMYQRRFQPLPTEPGLLLDRLYLLRGGLLTNAVVILFAKEPARFLPQTRARAVHFADDKREKLLAEQAFEGHIFRLHNLLEGFLQKSLATEGDLTNATSGAHAEQASYPPEALRDALWNALMHRDYSRTEGSICLSLYPQRLEIWNSGELLEGVKLNPPRASNTTQLRNPDIAHILLLRGKVERMGTGALRILETCQAAGLPTPRWEVQNGGTKLTFYL